MGCRKKKSQIQKVIAFTKTDKAIRKVVSIERVFQSPFTYQLNEILIVNTIKCVIFII